MVRRHGRILIVLFTCLLMQFGLLVGTLPVSAQEAHAHVSMAGCDDMAGGHCSSSPHAMPMEHTHHHARHQEPCCHIHACVSDLSFPAPVHMVDQPPGVNRHAFIFPAQLRPVGGDWLPPLRPPKSRNS